jgi:GNAT superfamily N-acetyltransferase
LKSSELLIRRLTPADVAPYRALRLRALRDHADAFTSSYEEESLRPESAAAQRLADTSSTRLWGAFVDGVMAGTVGLDFEQRLKARHKAMVIGMFVAPEFTRRGIARALIENLVRDARASQIELLILTVTDGNHGAQQLYLDTGFVSFGIEPRAIRVQNRYFAKNHMYLNLQPS